MAELDSDDPTVAEISRQLRSHVEKVHSLVQQISEVVDDLQEHAEEGVKGDYERRYRNQPHEPERKDG